MSPIIFGLLLASALVHAGWNALVKNSQDRFWSISVITLVGGIAALPFALVLESPTPTSWPYLIISSLLQIGYCLFLVRAYQYGDLASVYPIARGSAPLLVTLGAALFASELPSNIGLTGIFLVSLGIILLALGKNRPDSKSIFSALAAGLFIASYMVIDGLGVRIAESATGYAAWQAAVAGLLIPLSYVVIKRRRLSLPRGKEGALIVLSGLLGTLGYCIAVWAMSLTTMGGVSAIREISILFAALIGIFILREKITLPKLLGAITVTSGAICLSIG